VFFKSGYEFKEADDTMLFDPENETEINKLLKLKEKQGSPTGDHA
jgi:hypothetical protein